VLQLGGLMPVLNAESFEAPITQGSRGCRKSDPGDRDALLASMVGRFTDPLAKRSCSVRAVFVGLGTPEVRDPGRPASGSSWLRMPSTMVSVTGQSPSSDAARKLQRSSSRSLVIYAAVLPPLTATI
jgi:hypothetical protein